MRIVRFLFAVWMCCLALPAWTQQADAKDVLDRTAAAFRKAGGVKIAFSIRAAGRNTKGAISLKGDKFLLETEGMTTWFDGHTQWSYLASSDEVNVSEPTLEELQSINPYAWLSIYNKDYRLKLAKIGTPQDDTVYKVVMTATKRSQEMQCLILYVEKETLRPLKISMVQRGSKDAAVVFINAYETGKAYPDPLFVFDKKAHPTAEVIDLR